MSKNVVLILADQMQYQRQGRLDGLTYTPNIDNLAATGSDFSHCFVSNPQCTPSRTSLQTGLYPHQAEVMTNYGFFGHTAHLGADADTIAHRFSASGYETCYLGKSHLGFPLERLGYREANDHGGVPGGLATVDQKIAHDACTFLQRPHAAPFFLIVSFHEPHPPFELVAPYEAHYHGHLPRPSSFGASLDGKPAYHSRRRATEDGGADRAHFEDELRRYLTMISSVDARVGDVLDVLESTGLSKDTIVAFTSDHGDMMGSHGLRLKGTFAYEELIRVPLIIRDPGANHRAMVDDLVTNVEVPAALIDLAGVTRSEVWATRPTLVDVLDQPRPESQQVVFGEHYAAYWGLHPLRYIRTPRWKYVDYYGADACAELYDLRDDPSEIRNVAGLAGHAALEAELRANLTRWWETTGGRTADYYESEQFRSRGAADLLDDNVKWAMT